MIVNLKHKQKLFLLEYSMNNEQIMIKGQQKSRLAKIFTSLLLVTAVFLTTIFGSGNAIAADLLSSNIVAANDKSAITEPTTNSKAEGLLYSNSTKVKSLNSVDDFVSPQTQKKLLDATQIPAVKQPILDRSDPNAKLLEKTKQMFDDAADFSAN